MKLISIVVPCYMEGAMVERFFKACINITDKIQNYNFEYIFVDDGSHDNTLEKIKLLSYMDSRVKYVAFSRNFGKEAAILAGLKSSRGDMIILMDADLQHPPSLIPKMIIGIESGYDSVAAKRISRKGESRFREVFSNMFYRLINKISDVSIVKGATDYRILTRQMLNSILEVQEYHRFTKGIFEWVGYNTLWVEYESEDRVEGESKWSFFSLFSYAIEGVVSFSTMPLKISSIMGMIFSCGSFFYFIYTLIKTIVMGVDMPGYASTICIITFLGGIQLIGLGIIGEYLARTYMEAKKRPVYFVKDDNLSVEKTIEKEESLENTRGKDNLKVLRKISHKN